MASEKVAMILKSRGAPFTPEEISAMPDSAAWAWVYSDGAQRAPRTKPKLPEVCFTGFGPEERARLEGAAAAAGLVVRTSVTKNLTYL